MVTRQAKDWRFFLPGVVKVRSILSHSEAARHLLSPNPKTSVKISNGHLTERRFAYLAPEPATDDEEKKTKEQDDEMVVNGEKPTRLWTVDVETQTATQKSSQLWEIARNEMDGLMVKPWPWLHTHCPKQKLIFL